MKPIHAASASLHKTYDLKRGKFGNRSLQGYSTWRFNSKGHLAGGRCQFLDCQARNRRPINRDIEVDVIITNLYVIEMFGKNRERDDSLPYGSVEFLQKKNLLRSLR